jgi:hypothetical protein
MKAKVCMESPEFNSEESGGALNYGVHASATKSPKVIFWKLQHSHGIISARKVIALTDRFQHESLGSWFIKECG